MLSFWLVFPAGILIATLVTTIGLGGGVLWMPFFLIVLNMRPETAVITSLLIQIAGMGSGSLAYIRQKKADTRLAFYMVLAAVPGVFIGTLVSGRIHRDLLEIILGTLMILTAFLLCISVNTPNKNTAPASTDDHEPPRGPLKFSVILIPAIMSTASGMLSISMGEWLVPAMKSRMAMTMHHAIATCIVITFYICITGFIAHIIMGAKPDMTIVSLAVPGVLIGGQFGPMLNRCIGEKAFQRLFILFLLLTGSYLALKGMYGITRPD